MALAIPVANSSCSHSSFSSRIETFLSVHVLSQHQQGFSSQTCSVFGTACTPLRHELCSCITSNTPQGYRLYVETTKKVFPLRFCVHWTCLLSLALSVSWVGAAPLVEWWIIHKETTRELPLCCWFVSFPRTFLQFKISLTLAFITLAFYLALPRILKSKTNPSPHKITENKIKEVLCGKHSLLGAAASWRGAGSLLREDLSGSERTWEDLPAQTKQSWASTCLALARA